MYVHHMAANGMVRKQVYLTASQNSRLARTAKRLQRSEAELLREALDRFLPGGSLEAIDTQQDSLFDIVGIGVGADRDLSERVDEILYGPTGG